MACLVELGIHFVEVPEEEFQPMGCNVFALASRQPLMPDQLPDSSLNSWCLAKGQRRGYTSARTTAENFATKEKSSYIAYSI